MQRFNVWIEFEDHDAEMWHESENDVTALEELWVEFPDAVDITVTVRDQ